MRKRGNEDMGIGVKEEKAGATASIRSFHCPPSSFPPSEETPLEQAVRLECLIPYVMRRLFTLENHPISELPLAQLRASMILEAGPRPLSALSEELAISVSAVTQLADRLERAGLVERVAETEDRRVKKLRLTPYGAELMRSRRAMRVGQLTKALEQLDAETRAMLLHALQALLEATAATAPEIPTDAQTM